MTYQVATGWDNEAGYTAFPITPVNPRVEGLRAGRRRTAGDGLLYDDGYLIGELVFDYLTRANKAAIDTALGLSSASSAKITIELPYGASRTVGNYNAIVERPDETVNIHYDRGRWVQVRYRLTRIHAT